MSQRRTVALCMIVRDEAAVIERCLRSARPYFDSWVIVDTGSLDQTPELIRRLLAGIPGQLHHRPWRDFGANRSELLDLARGAADYLLLLDADQTVHGTGLPELDADCYAIRHEDEAEMWVPRLLKAGDRWGYRGRTHEQLTCDRPFEVTRLGEIVVRHHADGGAHAHKLLRDQSILEKDVVADPTDARAAFYLAETYRGLDKTSAAIDMYERRVALGGPLDEEVFYAAYQAAALTAQLDPDLGIARLLDTWNRRPTRVEPLYDAALAARLKRDHDQALSITEKALGITPPDDGLFVHRWMYDWGVPIEHAAALGHLGRVPEGVAIVDELLRTPGFPMWLDVDLLLFRQWLEDCVVGTGGTRTSLPPVPLEAPVPREGPLGRIERPPLLEQLIGPVPTVPLAGELPAPWSPLNPSVAATGDGFGVLIRLANWRYVDWEPPDPLIPWTRYIPQGGDQFNRNRAQLRFHDADGACTSIVDVKEPFERPRLPVRIRGLEDCRLFWWRGSWHVIACVVDTTPDDLYQMALLRIDGDRFVDFMPLLGPVRGRDEKNWMPFVVDDRLLLVYGCHPFVVLEWDPEYLELREVQRVLTPPSMAGLRGGSQGLPLEDGFLFLVHERRDSKTRMLYEHRLLKVDRDLAPVAMSRAFVYQRYGIEFCAGIAAWGDDVLMSYGVQDHSAWLAVVGRQELLSLLEPIDFSHATPPTVLLPTGAPATLPPPIDLAPGPAPPSP